MSYSPLIQLGLAAALALGAGPGGEAFAQSTDDMAALRANCQMDYMRLCAGMSPGGPEVRECFRRNRPNLSDGCGSAIDTYHRHEQERQASH